MSTPEKPVVHSDPEIMSGTPGFVGTRVPFQTLLDYLEAGHPLSEFLRELVGHDARTTPEMGWASKRNGEQITHQQVIAERGFA